jgi:hypothetical protein
MQYGRYPIRASAKPLLESNAQVEEREMNSLAELGRR